MNTRRFYACLLLPVLLFGGRLYAQKNQSALRHIVDTSLATHPGATGIIVSVISEDGTVWKYAAGIADKHTQKQLSPGQPVLVASNTKTYISAAILKLCEQKKLNTGDSIGSYLTKGTRNKLANDGYDTRKITLTHLLSHTSGINDYVNDDYFNFVNTHRQYRWNRDEQIDSAMRTGDPLAQPEDTFKYADVNYLLLTEIIEQITHKPFYKAVRELLQYRQLGLNTTWFTSLEPKPRKAGTQAHQYWNKYPWDSYDLDPSWDLYGGGGIVTTAEDMGLFFKYLFEGKIIKDEKLIAKLYTPVPCKTKTNYCLGLRNVTMEGLAGYYHGGFWGTDAIYFPELKTAVAIVVLERGERELSASICKAIAATLKKERTSE